MYATSAPSVVPGYTLDDLPPSAIVVALCWPLVLCGIFVVVRLGVRGFLLSNCALTALLYTDQAE